MASTTFSDVTGTTIVSAWLNDVNAVVYQSASGVTGSVDRTQLSKNAERVSVKDFGAVGNGVANDTAAINLAIAYELANKKGLWFPAGTYNVTATVAFLGSSGIRDVSFQGLGKVIISCSGAGPVATLDSGAATDRCDGITFKNFILKGNATSTYGLYTRGLIRSRVETIRAIDVATAGFKIDWSVCSNFKDIIMSDNIDTFSLSATKGLILDESVLGNYTADCLFENVIMEGTTAISDVGIEIVSAGLSNTFRGGTCEGLVHGLRTLSTSRSTVVEGMDFEANTDYDISVGGIGLTLRDVNASSAATTGTTIIAATARDTKFYGGYQRWVALNASSLGTHFYGTSVEDNASVGITGPTIASIPAAGIHQAYGVQKVALGVPTGRYEDVYAPPLTWTPALASAGGGAQGAVTIRVGTHSLVGKMCFVQGAISIAKGTLGAGALSITGLPYAARNVTNAFQYLNLGEWSNVALGAGYTHATLRLTPGFTTAALVKAGLGVVSAALNVADFPDPITFFFSGSYEII